VLRVTAPASVPTRRRTGARRHALRSLRRSVPAQRAAVEIAGTRYHDDDACAGEIRRRMAAKEL
jgi:hypothetical protein